VFIRGGECSKVDNNNDQVQQALDSASVELFERQGVAQYLLLEQSHRGS
jgi:hypothetical protein